MVGKALILPAVSDQLLLRNTGGWNDNSSPSQLFSMSKMPNESEFRASLLEHNSVVKSRAVRGKGKEECTVL